MLDLFWPEAVPDRFEDLRIPVAAVAATIAATLTLGIETGVSVGVALSILLHLLNTAQPHVAEVGLVPGTEHFRNIHRHKVETHPHQQNQRIDESH